MQYVVCMLSISACWSLTLSTCCGAQTTLCNCLHVQDIQSHFPPQLHLIIFSNEGGAAFSSIYVGLNTSLPFDFVLNQPHSVGSRFLPLQDWTWWYTLKLWNLAGSFVGGCHSGCKYIDCDTTFSLNFATLPEFKSFEPPYNMDSASIQVCTFNFYTIFPFSTKIFEYCSKVFCLVMVDIFPNA